jgi:histidyl-tRNA synthetase
VSLIEQYLNISGSNTEKITAARELLGQFAAGSEGLRDIAWLDDFLGADRLVVDFTLARGLNYYTGTIFEVRAKGVQIGSIGGGGRYDDLTGLFGVPGIPGVGISFGVDRIYDVMEELQLFPPDLAVGTRVLFFHLGEAESAYAYQLMQSARKEGSSCELFHEQAKFDKQFKYAEKKKIPIVVIAGAEEMASATCKVKLLATGAQHTVDKDALPKFLHTLG